ncbi:hypothetical protein [Mesorhizobium sp. M1B.F.Ca.ET.045.04.1.1]|uniref:hypothetical protein n=1 Tax=Mesorhizobium sp. M1B.F.Ca.ET.045.04.1.1 TaxID=2493673 RepID=UPI000F74C044|nr:hypothetical protein [Mesorhizobium sp. M1B.F.Ca.ET.045.04.1.1]AZO27402.1 hypothetical protein EJ071_08220 [Mesorhizobium sp. M1B.F.Ca.ET.045.04.1.1]
MRSFKLPLTFKLPRTAALAALVVAVPFAGAYAASAGFYTPRTAGLIDQAQSVDQGITAARQMDKIKPAEARDLHRQAVRISRVAQREAAAGHGAIPSEQYQQLVAQLDDVSQSLRNATGSSPLIGDGADGGYYLNG